MKIGQILYERISLAKYAPKLIDKIHTSIAFSFYQLLSQDKDLKGKNSNELQTISQNYPSNDLQESLKIVLEKSIIKTIRDFIKQAGYPSVSINFSKIPTSDSRGYAYSNKENAQHEISLSNSYINLIISLSKSVYKNVLTNYPSIINELTTPIGNNKEVLIIKQITEKAYSKFVNKMANTIIHELTHSAQNLAQDHNNKDDYEYRSLKQPDLDSFTNTPRNKTEYDQTWGWYRSSPQEIDAFAQGTATDILTSAGVKDNDNITTTEYKQIFNNVMSELNKMKSGQDYGSFYKRGLINKENYIDDKVRNKYYKKVIQAVSDYLDDIKKKIN